MDLQALREELTEDEGCVYEVYNDHLGYPTFGIGHLILDSDPEQGSSVGTPVSESRVAEAFESDIVQVLSDCETLYPDFESLPEDAQRIIANMMFNMGRPRYSGFKKHLAALWAGDWAEAGRQARDSRWHGQVGDRAERLCLRLEEIDGE